MVCVNDREIRFAVAVVIGGNRLIARYAELPAGVSPALPDTYQKPVDGRNTAISSLPVAVEISANRDIARLSERCYAEISTRQNEPFAR